MRTTYEIWDTASANQIAEFSDKNAWKALVLDILIQHGIDAVRPLSVGAYDHDEDGMSSTRIVFDGSRIAGGAD